MVRKLLILCIVGSSMMAIGSPSNDFTGLFMAEPSQMHHQYQVRREKIHHDTRVWYFCSNFYSAQMMVLDYWELLMCCFCFHVTAPAAASMLLLLLLLLPCGCRKMLSIHTQGCCCLGSLMLPRQVLHW
ncbi:uncharacterized protein LOC110703436 isoform X2 [Chenopodium quinoa]|uniref:uncharacterized protein LOC110703436 isoform X2 n=1 Tax=Chenopodium quinoa TaxID=63459 RepID=UPI000B7987C8|nr:uncharacterized protein LOC110703436 isoform X2 [Chenopodium quinoa]